MAGFYGGIQYQKSQRVALGRGQFPAGFNQREGSSQRGLRPSSGEITKIDDTSLTLKTTDGSSKIIIFSDSTRVNKSSEGSMADLKVGESITVMGSEDTNGTITAEILSVGNMFRGPMGEQSESGGDSKAE